MESLRCPASMEASASSTAPEGTATPGSPEGPFMPGRTATMAEARIRGGPQKETRGAWRAESSASKYCAFSKWNIPAMMLLGTVSVDVLNFMTTSL